MAVAARYVEPDAGAGRDGLDAARPLGVAVRGQDADGDDRAAADAGNLRGAVRQPAGGVVLAQRFLQELVGTRPDLPVPLGDLAYRLVLDPVELDRHDAAVLAPLDDPGARVTQPREGRGDPHVVRDDEPGVGL